MLGNWCFKNGETIGFQEIVDVFEPDDKIKLLILSDCCYSGFWAKKLKQGTYHSMGNISLTYYSSCDADEVAEEKVFTDLLEGHVPDLAGGGDFSVLRDHAGKVVQG